MAQEIQVKYSLVQLYRGNCLQNPHTKHPATR